MERWEPSAALGALDDLLRVTARGGRVAVVAQVSVVNPLSAALWLADDRGHGHDPTRRHVHRGRQAVGRRPA